MRVKSKRKIWRVLKYRGLHGLYPHARDAERGMKVTYRLVLPPRNLAYRLSPTFEFDLDGHQFVNDNEANKLLDQSPFVVLAKSERGKG